MNSVLITYVYDFVYLLLAVLGLCCCAGLSLVVASGGYSLAAVCRLLMWLSGVESACQGRRCSFDPSSGRIPHATDQ